MGPRANKINGANTQAVPCSATYALNTQVTLTATPDAGSSFSGWFGGGCSGVGTCQVTLNNAKVVMAMFSKPASGFTVSYYHTDRLGSVRAMTDASGALVGDRHDYAPFGEDTASITGNPMRFGGKELDAETALHYFEARYYRQTWGRFTQVDPVSGWASDPQSWDRYAYARNNPLKYVDPTGRAYYVYSQGGSSFSLVTAYFSSDLAFGQLLEMNHLGVYTRSAEGDTTYRPTRRIPTPARQDVAAHRRRRADAEWEWDTRYATSTSARGFLAAISNSVRAAPEGARRPCSHSCSVRTETPRSSANLGCDSPVPSLMVTTDGTVVTRPCSPRLS